MYLSPEPATLTRHYVAAGGRQVHYRLAGDGPPVVLLHQSPTSSAELADLATELAAEFTVVAPDTPGFGLSCDLSLERPGIGDYAEALAGFMDALGLARACLYGVHTGAMIAAEFALRYPERCAAAVLDGYVVLADAERADLLAHYCEDPPPRWDGGHLAWLWGRIRDQAIFFPWYRKERAARMRFDVKPAPAIEPFLHDLMRAGLAATRAYRAAFSYDAADTARRLQAPVWIMSYAQDAIAHHAERLPDLAPSVRVELHADAAALRRAAAGVFRRHSRGGHWAPPPPAAPDETLRRCYLGPAGNRLHGSWRLRRGTCPLVLLHDAGGSSRDWLRLPLRSLPARTLWLPDLPGHGESAAPTGGPADLDAMAGAVLASCQAAGFDQADVAGLGAGAVLAAHVAVLDPQRFGRALVIDLPLFPAAEREELAARAVPDLTPRDHGGHLLAAWYAIRDSEIFRPWYRTACDASLDREPELDPATLHERAFDLLKAGPAAAQFLRAALEHDLRRTVAALGDRARHLARRGNGVETAAALAAACAGQPLGWLPAATSDWKATHFETSAEGNPPP